MNEYFLEFTQFARYTPSMFANSRAHMSKFVATNSEDMIKECRTTILVKKMDI